MTHTVPASHCFGRVADLSDDELLASVRRIVGRSNQLLASLLAHLGEVEARGIHRVRGCASVYTYCIYELRMPEDTAFRRARAARIAREYPIVLEKIAAGEIHLTALLMLGPHLTRGNHVHVLERAKHRSKKEVASLVRMLDPLPDVASAIEPLGPARSGVAVRMEPTWSDFVAALSGPVRELQPGDRPKDWIDAGAERLDDDANPAAPEDLDSAQPAEASGSSDLEADLSLTPQRYKVQFTATQEYVDLLEEARNLLAHPVPSRALEEVHLRAMRLLVDELKKRKYAVTDQPKAQRPKRAGRKEQPAAGKKGPVGDPNPRRRGFEGAGARPRSRYIPAPVRRAVWQRDRGRCTYIDARGQRCRETRYLELHHEQPHARRGPPTTSNIRLRCRAHNALAAEEDFGRELMTEKKTRAASKPEGPW